MTGDLHCHTKLSDGSVGIDELISLAKKTKLEAIAITDHDTLAGTVRAKIIGERQGLKVIPGVELSAYDFKRQRNVHLISYLSESPDRLEGLCKRISGARRKSGQLMIMKTMQRYPVSAEHIIRCSSGSTNIFKQHIMHALMDAGFSTAIFGELYRELFSETEGGRLLVKVEYPDVLEVLTAIHDAGGIAVLAHPAVYDSFDVLEEDLIPAGIDGVEVWHPRNTEEDRRRLAAIADENGLLKTGGTDFHGMYSAQPLPLGTCITPEENMDELLSYKTRQRRQKRVIATG